MPMKPVANFSVPYLQILDENDSCDENEMPKLTDDEIKTMYEYMVFSRLYDDMAVKLQREGRMLTYAPLRGQEAAEIGSAFALRKQDWIFPSFRESASLILRGMPLHLLYLYWMGDERGAAADVNNFTMAIPVATQIPHAVGFAWAQKMKKEDVVTLVYFGDGATSRGDFHEGLNFAGVFKLPVVFVCLNNQWAISVPRERQTASQTLAQKALGYGFEGIQVDGNDVFAVYKATKEAVEKAKDGPTLIECVTYRIGDHTTADDASKYRTKEEVEEWTKKDPIERLRKYMESKGLWNQNYEDILLGRLKERVDEAVKKAESTEAPKREDMFKYTYSEMPWFLKEQMSGE